MRMMMKVMVPAAKGTESIGDGSMEKTLADAMEKPKPEAAYFAMQNGQRCSFFFFFFEMDDVADLPSVTEPMWKTSRPTSNSYRS